MLRRFFAVLGGVLFAALPALAQRTPSWVELSTTHFTVYTDSRDRDAIEVAQHLEQIHSVFAQLLPGVHDDPGTRVIVFALHDDQRFNALLPPAYLQKNAMELAGIFLPGQDRSYIALHLDGDGERPFATVYHEYTHHMLRHLPALPLWLNEGEAEFFQNTEMTRHEVRLGEPSRSNILFLREQKLLPLPTLFLVGRDSPFYHEDGKGSIFYAESWALTHFLSLADSGKPHPRLEIYSTLLREGESPLLAAHHAFGDLAVLQAQLEAYVHQGDFQALRMPLPEVALQTPPAPHPVASATVNALRAEFLVRAGREAEGVTLARDVLALSPHIPEASETLGLVSLQHKDLAAAQRWYSDAVRAGSTSFLAFYYSGALALRDGPAAAQAAEQNLRESLRLNPRFAPTLDALAQCDALAHDHLDEALEYSLRAVSAEPDTLQHRLAASEVHIARREFAEAHAVLEAALSLARTDAERTRIQDRLRDLQAFQAQEPGR